MKTIPTRSSIRTRLIVTFLAVTTIPLVILSIYTAGSHLDALEDMARSSAARQAIVNAGHVQAFLDTAASDLFFLSQMPSLSAYIEAETPEAEVGTFSREKLATQFEALIAGREGYRAACYADELGHDAFCATARVGESAAPRDLAGVEAMVRRITATTDELLAGQMRTVVDRAGDGDAVLFVTRILPRGRPRGGYLWIKASPSALFGSPETTAGKDGFVLLDEHDNVIAGTAPAPQQAQLAGLKATPHESVLLPRGDLLTLVPLRPRQLEGGASWSFVAVAPQHAAFRELTRYRWVFAGVLLATLLLSGIMSVLVAGQFTRPLTQLYDAAREIGRGNLDVELRDWTGDEIGGLAAELQVMASRLREKRDAMQGELDDKERELLRAERLSTIGTMSAAIAHEVHNPLGIILMYSQMLAEQIPPDDPRVEKLRTISCEGARIALLVRGLLQFARRPEPVMQTMPLEPMLREAVAATVSLNERNARIPIDVAVDPSCDTIDVDPDQFQQVLRNLLVNACHAVGESGRVSLSAAPDGDDHVIIRVNDTGPGIPADVLPRLFEPFFTTKKFGTGTGLGLAIAKEVVEHHGGTISVNSEPDQGATFCISMPRSVGKQSAAAGAPSATDARKNVQENTS